MDDRDKPGLEINQDLGFQERAWRIERFAWGMLGLLILLGLLGLFGTGPISSVDAGSSDDGIVVDYERFVRHDGRASLEIEVAPAQVNAGEIELWISTDYLADIEIDAISTEPDEVRIEGDRQVYVFLTGELDRPVPISISFRPVTFGVLSGEAGIADGPSISFRQLSYP